MGMTVVQEKAVGNDVINDTAMDRDAAKNLVSCNYNYFLLAFVTRPPVDMFT